MKVKTITITFREEQASIAQKILRMCDDAEMPYKISQPTESE